MPTRASGIPFVRRERGTRTEDRAGGRDGGGQVSDVDHRPPDVEAIRRAMADDAAGHEREPVRHVVDVDAGVPCRVYVPDAPRGTLIFAHGGGFVFGDLDTHDAHMRRIVNRTGWAVIAVHYRRSPEHSYPAAVEDMDRALRWLDEDGRSCGVPTTPAAVIGDSAGAKLALVLALGHPGRFAAVVLVYPFVDPRLRFVSTAPEKSAAAADARWYWDVYLGDGVDPADPAVSPIDSPDLGALPPVLIVTAGQDYLCGENEELARRIAAAGGEVAVDHHSGVDHGFWRRPDSHPESERSLATLASFLGRVA